MHSLVTTTKAVRKYFEMYLSISTGPFVDKILTYKYRYFTLTKYLSTSTVCMGTFC